MEIVEMNGMEIQIQIKFNLSTHVQLKPVYLFIYPKKSNQESWKNKSSMTSWSQNYLLYKVGQVT